MNKKIVIRKILKSDVKNAKAFQKYLNDLVEENAMIARNEKASLKAEKEFLEDVAKLPKQIQYKGKLVDEFVMNKYL